MLAWIDLETTGLKPPGATPIEAALIITDDHLRIEAYHQWLIRPFDGPVNWPAKVQEMHSRNGLIHDLTTKGGGFPIIEAEALMLDFVTANRGTGVPLCGSTVGFDRKFLEVFMPALDAIFHYRSIDVSSIKELVSRWYPQHAYPSVPEEQKAHRALPDLQESIKELQWYRDRVFISPLLADD